MIGYLLSLDIFCSGGYVCFKDFSWDFSVDEKGSIRVTWGLAKNSPSNRDICIVAIFSQ